MDLARIDLSRSPELPERLRNMAGLQRKMDVFAGSQGQRQTTEASSKLLEAAADEIEFLRGERGSRT